MKEAPSSRGGGYVRSGDRLFVLWTTPGQRQLIQVPWPPHHGHGRLMTRGCRQPQEGAD